MIYVTDKATQQELDIVKGRDYKKLKTIKTIKIDGVDIDLYKVDGNMDTTVKKVDAFGGEKNE